MNEQETSVVETPKRTWQRPAMEELDLAVTESNYVYAAPFTDFGIYSA